MTFMWVQLQSFLVSLFLNLHDEFLLFQNVGSPRESNAQDKSIATLFSLGEPRAIPLELFIFSPISLFSNCSRHVHMSVGFEMSALPLIHP